MKFGANFSSGWALTVHRNPPNGFNSSNVFSKLNLLPVPYLDLLHLKSTRTLLVPKLHYGEVEISGECYRLNCALPKDVEARTTNTCECHSV